MVILLENSLKFPSKEAYFESINRFDLDSERIEYNEKGDVVVHLD